MIVKFKELYAEDLENQKARYEKLIEGFKAFYGYDENLEFFSAPGRSEVGGNHTDHQKGCVLAASVNLDIIGAVAKRDDNKISLKSLEYEKCDLIDLNTLEVQEDEIERSASVIRGISARCKQLGFEIGGFDCYTMSNVLKGSGLSSSAAFEVLVATVINHLYNDDKITPVQIAQICQYAENVYFGKPSGLLDQSASSVGGFTAIDFKDTQNPVFEQIAFDLAKYGHNLCVVDTGGNHADLTYEYAAVPNEIKAVAQYMGKEVMREVDEEEFYKNIPAIREKLGDRGILRAIHFYGDNKRAQDMAKALKEENFEQFLAYVTASGYSSATMLQNVFCSASPNEQGLSLALAITKNILNGKGACRVHGGGFAGTIQAYIPCELQEEYKEKIEAVFGKGSCYVLNVRPVGGTKVEL